MEARRLSYNITDIDPGQLVNCSVTASHGSTTSLATIETLSTKHRLDQHITITIGDNINGENKVFSGYIKSIETSIPSNTRTITANDDLIRASEMFIVSSDPDKPLTYKNILDKELIKSLLALAQITNIDLQSSDFTFGTANEFTISQVSVLDYCKQIADLLAWTIWCDENGTVHFKCRKPHVMAGTDAGAGTILGWVNDTPISTSIYDWNDSMVLTLSKGNNENDLRNRVLVYGTEGVFAEAKYESTPYFKWKTAVFAAPDLIDTIDIARKTANYNLALLNKLTETISATVEGNSNLMPFKTVMVNSSNYGMSGEYYIYSVNHDFGKDGYTTKLELRK